jgi:hypothetical protein
VPIDVPERLHLEMLDLRASALDSVEEHGNHDQSARILRHSVLERDPGKTAGRATRCTSHCTIATASWLAGRVAINPIHGRSAAEAA